MGMRSKNESQPATQADLKKLKTAVQSDIKKLETKLKDDISVLKTDVSELKTDVSELKTDVSELKTDVSGLKTDVSGMRTGIFRLTSELVNTQAQVREWGANMATKDDISRVLNAIDTLSGQTLDNRRTVLVYDNILGEHGQKLESHEKRIVSLEAKS